MTKSPLFITLALLLLIFSQTSAQYQFGNYVVNSPCPREGTPVENIEGTLTSTTRIKKFPETGSNCDFSSQRTAYEEHFIFVEAGKPISVVFQGDQLRLDVYDLKYNPGEPCAHLIKTILPGVSDTIRSAENQYLVLVVSSFVPVTIETLYNITFGSPTGNIPENCLYNCAQKEEVVKFLFPYEPLETNFGNSFLLTENNSLINDDCIEYIIRNHQFRREDTSFNVESVYIPKPLLVETSFDLQPLKISCSIRDFSLNSLRENLHPDNDPKAVDEFYRLLESVSLSKNQICGFPVVSDAKVFGIDEVVSFETDSFELKVDYVEWCAEKIYRYVQKFILERTGNVDTVLFDKKTVMASPLSCNHKFVFSEPENVFGCTGDAVFYHITGPVPVNLVNRNYEADLIPGDYTFLYSIFDCCSNRPLQGTIEIEVTAPGLVTGLAPSVSLFSEQVTTPGLIFTQLTNHPCYNIETKILGSTSACGTVTNDMVTFCCDDLMYSNDTTVAQGLVTLETKVVIDVNNDGVFGNVGDDVQNIKQEIQVFDHIQSILCPPDLVLPCTTTDTGTNVTGQAIVNATCFDTYLAGYTDEVDVINPDKSIITRTFTFFGYNSVHRCIQKIELDCTVSSEEVLQNHPVVKMYPNPSSQDVHLFIEAPSAQETKISVRNVVGIEISQLRYHLKPGQNDIILAEPMFSGAGTYFIDLIIDSKNYTLPLIRTE
jgi:hypothetical protein